MKIIIVQDDFEGGQEVGYFDIVDWWLAHYKGLEHMHIAPETMYTITSILERCLEKLKKNEPT